MDYVSEFISKSKNPIFQDISKIIKIKSKSACGKNENFLGQVLRVNCLVEMKSGETKHINLIVKKAPTDAQPLRKMFYEHKIFDFEVDTYENVLFKMENILKKHKIDDWNLWPVYYGHNNSDIFIQDLCDLGYTTYGKRKSLELPEALLVFKSLGRFHGISLSLIQQGLYDPSNMPLPNIFVRKISALDIISIETLNNLANAIEAEWSSEWQIYSDRLRKLSKNIIQRGNDLWYETRGNLDVINHGDFWVSNMMFKYDDDGVLQKMKFIDFQSCHYNSYSWDLMQVLYSAVLPKFRNDNLELLLKTYHESLTETCGITDYQGDLPDIKQIKLELDRLDILSLERSLICYTYFFNDVEIDEAAEAEDKLSVFRPSIVKELIKETLTYFNDRNIF